MSKIGEEDDGLIVLEIVEDQEEEVSRSGCTDGDLEVEVCEAVEQKVLVAMDNLGRCMDAVLSESNWSKIFSNLSFKPMLCVENSIFNLAASEETDSTMYMLVIKSALGHIVRYFESGNLQGFFEAEGHSYVKSSFAIQELLPYAVFSPVDVQLRSRQRKKSESAPVKKSFSTYQRLLSQNKHSHLNELAKLNSLLDGSKQLVKVFLLSFILHKRQLFRSNNEKSKHAKKGLVNRHLFCSSEEHAPILEKLMLDYRKDERKSKAPVRCVEEPCSKETLGVEEQYFMICSLPNLKLWPWPGEVIRQRHEAMFSTSRRYYPSSPRNRILQALCIGNGGTSVIVACLKNIFGCCVKVPYVSKAVTLSGSPKSRGQNERGQGSWESRAAEQSIKIESDEGSSLIVVCDFREDEDRGANSADPSAVNMVSKKVQSGPHLLETAVTSLVKLRMLQCKDDMKSDNAVEEVPEPKKLCKDIISLNAVANDKKLSTDAESNNTLSVPLHTEPLPPDKTDAVATVATTIILQDIAQVAPVFTVVNSSLSVACLPIPRCMSAPLAPLFEHPDPQELPTQQLTEDGPSLLASKPASIEIALVPNNTQVVHANSAPRMTSRSSGPQIVIPRQPGLISNRVAVPTGSVSQHVISIRQGLPAGTVAWSTAPSQVLMPYSSLPKLKASISSSSAGIILTWDRDSQDVRTNYSVKCYHLFAHQVRDSSGESAPTEVKAWKKIGVVDALPLPMACTLTKFATGNVYHFAVLAVDVHGREGPLSKPCTLRLDLNTLGLH